jgi:hypothetical protein
MYDLGKAVCRCAGGLLACAIIVFSASAANALELTAAAIFSSNPVGQAYNGLIWNTVGNPPDITDRWNVYFSSSTDINNPVFLNDGNGAGASIDIPLAPGVYSFGMYGEAAGNHTDHFTLSLYFDGDDANPGISAVAPVNGTPVSFVAASHPDGLGLLASQGFVANANSLSFMSGGMMVTLTEYFWSTDTSNHPDLVWPHNQRHDFGPSPAGADFYGQITLTVTAVPEPGTFALFGIGIAGIGLIRRHRRSR